MMDIAAEIAAWDGKRTATLETLAARLAPDPDVVGRLSALAGTDEPGNQVAATWLLKRFQEAGYEFSKDESGALVALMDKVAHWEARLHLLQLLPHLAVAPDRADGLFAALQGNRFLGDGNKFVRAWTYNALADLATRNPALRPRALEVLTQGGKDAAASVKARLRAIARQTDWIEGTL